MLRQCFWLKYVMGLTLLIHPLLYADTLVQQRWKFKEAQQFYLRKTSIILKVSLSNLKIILSPFTCVTFISNLIGLIKNQKRLKHFWMKRKKHL